jgi:hypothetical protein
MTRKGPTRLQLLLRMRALFRDSKCIDRTNMASNRRGEAVDPWDKSAVRWCVVGALACARGRYLGGGEDDHEALVLLERAAPLGKRQTWADYVERISHGKLVGAIDRAIVEARRKSPRAASTLRTKSKELAP